MKAWLLLPLLAFGAGYLARGRPEISAPSAAAERVSILPGGAPGGPDSPPRRMPAPDSAASLKEVLRLTSDAHRLAALAQLLDQLSPPELAALVHRLSERPGYAEFELLKLAYKRWAEVAPEEALRSAAENLQDQGRVFRGAFYEALMVRARGNLDAALAELASLPVPHKREYVHGMRVQALLQGDNPPAVTLDHLGRIDANAISDRDRGAAIGNLAKRWFQDDPAAAWNYLLGLPRDAFPPEQIAEIEWAIFSQQAAADPARALAYLRTIPDPDPAGPPRLATLQQAYVAALASAGRLDQANSYAANLPPGAARAYCLDRIAEGFLDSGNLAGGIAFLQNLAPGDWGPNSFRDSWQRLAEQAPDQATALLRSKIETEGIYLGNLASALRSVIGAASPESAAELVDSLPPRPAKTAMGWFLPSWTQTDAPAAAQWALSRPEGDMRTTALALLETYWINGAPQQAADWLQSLPPGTDRDTAVGTYARITFSEAPDAALAWLQSITDQPTRLQALHDAWTGWQNRPAAEAWAVSANLTDAERAVLKP